jgi:hypothetical protein
MDNTRSFTVSINQLVPVIPCMVLMLADGAGVYLSDEGARIALSPGGRGQGEGEIRDTGPLPSRGTFEYKKYGVIRVRLLGFQSYSRQPTPEPSEIG